MRCQHLQSLLGGARDPIIHFNKRRRRHFKSRTTCRGASSHFELKLVNRQRLRSGGEAHHYGCRGLRAAPSTRRIALHSSFNFQVSTWGSSAQQRRILVMIALVGPTRGTPSPFTHSAHTTPPHPSVHPRSRRSRQDPQVQDFSPPIQKFGDHLEAQLGPFPLPLSPT